MENFLNTFVPEKSTAVIMPIGEVDVILKQAKPVTDHDANLSGAPKKDYAYADLHGQVAMTFVRADGKPGIITERFNTLGFKRFDELSPKEQKKCRKDEHKGYALDKNGNRLIDEVRTNQCKSVFNQFLNQLTEEDGSLTIERIAGKPFSYDSIVGTRCRITVEEKLWDGETRNRITKYRRITSKPVLADVAGADGEEQKPF